MEMDVVSTPAMDVASERPTVEDACCSRLEGADPTLTQSAVAPPQAPQAPTTTESVDNIAGQGIGMNVVKQHVDSAGGKLNIKSSKGNFCEFKILLPV